MLHLIKMWLEAPVEEKDERGRKRRTTCNKDEGKGTPQGAPISPLLSNIYMRRFVLGWKQLGHAARFNAEIVNYADDFVICCRVSAREALTVMRGMMGRLKLTVNEAKTRTCRVAVSTDQMFGFLGYTIGRRYSQRTGKAFIAARPSDKKIAAVKAKISEMTRRWKTGTDTGELTRQLNGMLVGWSNYFQLGPVLQAYRMVDYHCRQRLRRWLRLKHKVPAASMYTRFPDRYLDSQLGLIRLQDRCRNFPWAKARNLVREPDAGKPPVRFDERGAETEHG